METSARRLSTPRAAATARDDAGGCPGWPVVGRVVRKADETGLRGLERPGEHDRAAVGVVDRGEVAVRRHPVALVAADLEHVVGVAGENAGVDADVRRGDGVDALGGEAAGGDAVEDDVEV